jgi:FAD binding domain-containing protein/D-arabinono-1,4-lactone oxidase
MKSNDPTKIWQNWAENLSATPAQRHTPTTLEEIVAIVKDAHARGQRMRVVGNSHSWSPLVPTEGVMICMQSFNAIHLSHDRRTVTMQAGVTVDQFAQFLLANDVCQPSGVGIGLGEAQYGGIISTGCHGSGIQQQSVSDWVVGLEIVAADGEVRSFSLEKDGHRVMNALRLSLGMCGVIHTITTKVEPMFRVHVVESKDPLSTTLENLAALVMDNDYAEVSWMPFNEGVWVQKANRTEAPITRDGFAPPDNPFMDLVYQAGSAMALNAIETDPSMTPSISKASFQVLNPGDYVAKITHYVHCADYRFFLDSYKISDIEVIFEIDEKFDSVRKAFAIAAAKINQWAAAGRYPLNVTLGFRFIKNSDATLSPARGNRYTCMVEIFSYYRTDLFETFAGELATAWMTELPRARPHFAKGFQFMKAAIPRMREAFGEQLQGFMDVRAELGVDPGNLFSNTILDELFGIRR